MWLVGREKSSALSDFRFYLTSVKRKPVPLDRGFVRGQVLVYEICDFFEE